MHQPSGSAALKSKRAKSKLLMQLDIESLSIEVNTPPPIGICDAAFGPVPFSSLTAVLSETLLSLFFGSFLINDPASVASLMWKRWICSICYEPGEL